jgi:deoxycytidylate deaminase
MKQFAMDAAKEIRLESDVKTKVGAALVKGNRILGLAANKRGSHSGSGTKWSIHAEVRCTANKQSKGATVYIYREHGLTGTPLYSRPCSTCREWLNTIGVKRIIYTTEDGYMEERL